MISLGDKILHGILCKKMAGQDCDWILSGWIAQRKTLKMRVWFLDHLVPQKVDDPGQD